VDCSIFRTVVVHGVVQVLCYKRFQLCRDNIYGVLEREGVVGREFVGEDDSIVLVRWRNVRPSCITAYLSVLVHSTK
jgi:hypothetical protein